MKILGIILLIIFALLTFLLFIPVNLRAYYDGRFKLELKVLFVKFSFPAKKKGKKQKNQKPKAKTDYKKLLSQIGDVKKILPKLFKRAFATLTVKRFNLDIIVATDDPCDTAIAYGAVNAATFSAMSLIEKILKIKNKKINITADYDKQKTEVTLDACITTRLYKILVCLISLIADGVINLK